MTASSRRSTRFTVPPQPVAVVTHADLFGLYAARAASRAGRGAIRDHVAFRRLAIETEFLIHVAERRLGGPVLFRYVRCPTCGRLAALARPDGRCDSHVHWYVAVLAAGSPDLVVVTQ
jgi:hypothetical protein